MTFAIYPDLVPYLTTAQMIEVDRAMIEDYHIEPIQIMENAGRSLAHLARIRFCSGQPPGKKVIVLAGTEGNGGGALVCARRLHNLGRESAGFLAKWAELFAPVPAHELDISVPPALYAEPTLGVESGPSFAESLSACAERGHTR